MADGSKLSVILPRGFHPFPSRTRQLSPAGPMVLHAKVCGRVGRCRHKIKAIERNLDGLFLLLAISWGGHGARKLGVEGAPTVFVSYSWDSTDHKRWVRELATRLQSSGVEVWLDQWDTHPGIDLALYMERCVRDANFVLLVCTPKFAARANAAQGGVGYEKSIVTGEILYAASPKKFVPVLRSGSPSEALPSYLKTKEFIDFRSDDLHEGSFDRLLRHLHGVPPYLRPARGPKPALTSVEGSESTPAGGHRATQRTTVVCVRCGRHSGDGGWCLGQVAHDFRQFGQP